MIVLEGGDAVFDALAYGVDRPIETASYFQQEINNISNTLSEVGKSFFSNVKTLYNEINNSDAVRLARAAIQSAATLFKPDTIMPLKTIEDLRSAGLVMQRWIMAQPEVRTAFHQQRIDGYSDTYIDMHPGVIGREHYDYRRVMDGIVEEDPNEDTWSVSFFPDDLVAGDRELMHDEKFEIISTWNLAKMFIEAGEEDPTSIYAGKM